MSNMNIYEQCAIVPEEAKKPILAGRLRGMTDINPMWRIKKLTEMFGVCGFGWYYDILEERLEEVSTGEVVAFVKINLFVKMDGEWSKSIVGTGGNKLVTKETKGFHVSDECFKMALTDAISVACKSLGMASSVYFEKDRTKYDVYVEEEDKQQPKSTNFGDATIPNTNKTQEKPSERDLGKECRDNIIKLYGKDNYVKKLQELTEFKGRDGNLVAGLESLVGISEKRIQVLHYKLKKLKEEIEKEKSNENKV